MKNFAASRPSQLEQWVGHAAINKKTVMPTGSDFFPRSMEAGAKQERPETAGSRRSHRSSRSDRSHRSRRSDRSSRSHRSSRSRGSKRPATAGSQRSHLSQSSVFRDLVAKATSGGGDRRAMKRAVAQKLRTLRAAIDDERRARSMRHLQLESLFGELGVLQAGAASDAAARARQAEKPVRKEKNYERRRSDVTRAYEDQIKSSSQDREIARLHRMKRRGHAAAAEAAMKVMLRGDGKPLLQQRFAKPP